MTSARVAQADRTVAAYALTLVAVAARDAGYQRGFPMEPASDTDPVDRGHLIPRLSEVETGWVHGGAFEFERFDNRPFAR